MNNERNATERGGKSRAVLIAAVCLIALAIAAIVAFLFFKDSLFLSIAQKNALKGDFRAALTAAERSSSDDADAIEEYAKLRIEINSRYPSMLARPEKYELDGWNTRASGAASIAAASEKIDDGLKAEIAGLAEKLASVCSLYDELETRMADISELMDLFAEINRLYTPGEDGNKPAFTIYEERQKISRWKFLLDEIRGYAYRLPEGDSIYLLSYMLKEAQGEIEDLEKAMDRIAATGTITESDTVRVSGSGKKVFPSVESSSGASVNLTAKEGYLEYLVAGIHRSLVGDLAEYYRGV